MSKEIPRWTCSIDRYPFEDKMGDWVKFSDHEKVEEEIRDLKNRNSELRYAVNKYEREIYELSEKLSALAGVIVDLKK